MSFLYDFYGELTKIVVLFQKHMSFLYDLPHFLNLENLSLNFSSALIPGLMSVLI
jgi:hypothetical protein